MAETFILPKQTARETAITRISRFLSLLPADKAWRVTVEQHRATRSDPQNRYLWGVCYPALTARLDGWDAEDVHEYFLGEHFGWETLDGLGRKRLKPVKRSSKLTTTEFSDYVAFIQRKAADLGIYIPDPEEACS
jgi:hypothetical protein